jgi:hypothetical protein
MDAIRILCTPMIGHGALSMVENGKQLPWDIVESSRAQNILMSLHSNT